MRYFDIALWDGVQEDAVLAGTFAKISQNPAMKQHVLGTGTKRLAEASPFDPAWGTGLREDVFYLRSEVNHFCFESGSETFVHCQYAVV